jgi:hypothetical protein
MSPIRAIDIFCMSSFLSDFAEAPEAPPTEIPRIATDKARNDDFLIMDFFKW